MTISSIDGWIWLALLAMIFNIAKAFTIKTICKNINPSVLVFYARLLPAILLPVPAYYSNYKINDVMLFSAATLLAAVITMLASVLYIRSMQSGELSLVSPIQASVPVFMILTTWILYDEKPGLTALLLILAIAFAVSYVLLKSAKSRNTALHRQVFLPVIMSFAAAALYGVSTIVDRIAISATSDGAILYSACWNGVTVALLGYYLARNHETVITGSRQHYPYIFVYALVVTFAFVLQQLSVQESIEIENGVTYVKAIVMLHIGIAALLGISILKEKVSVDLLLSNAVALAAGMALVTVV